MNSRAFLLRPIFGLLILLAILAPTSARAIEVQRVESPGGIKAWLVEDHTNPIIALSFAFRGGAALDPEGRQGLADMVSTLLDEGAGDLKSQDFQRRLEDLSVGLDFSAERDNFSGRLRTLTRNRDAAFGLLKLALAKPRFDADAVARMRSQILAGLRQDLENPDAIAARRLFKTFFPDHPYGRPTDGTLKTVAAITIDDLRAFARSRFAKSNLIIGVTGDVTAGELGPLLDSTFGDLPSLPSGGIVRDVTPRASNDAIKISKPMPQSTILFGQAGMKRDNPDFYAAYVMNYVLGGGGLTSRLFDEVREKRGLAYSVGSNLYPLKHAALILGSAGTASAMVGKTLKVVRAVWKRMAKGGMTAAELKDAKTYLTGSFPLRFTSSRRIANILVGMQLDNLGIDYLKKRNGYIKAVTLDQVNRVARQLLKPGELTFVIVGEPDGMARKTPR
jgi:zinc protease